MARELFAKTKQKVVPFEQSGQFYHKKARKHMENNNYINALNLYRKAIEKEPDNIEYLLDISEVFTEMGYYDESNRILFSILQKDKSRVDCYFGLGCNFLGLQEFDKAEECFERYLVMDPHGMYWEDAHDLLYVLKSHEYFVDDFEESDSDKKELYQIALRGKDLLDRGKYEEAIRELEKVAKRDSTLIFAKNNLALAYFCVGKLNQAIEISKEVLDEDPYNVHANCNLALFFYENGDTEACGEAIQVVLGLNPEDPEDIHKIAVTLCELKEHDKANRYLRKLLQYKPYDIRVLHYYAVSCFNLGRYKEALLYWDKIAKIDPRNSISTFYKRMANNCIINGEECDRELPYHFQVPYDEIIRRIKALNEFFRLTDDELSEKWKENEYFRSLLYWGLDLNDSLIKRAILNVVASFRDEEAEEFLRLFLLRKNEDKKLKQEVVDLLKEIDAAEPYIAYIDNDIVEIKVEIPEVEAFEIPPQLKKVLDLALDKMHGRYREGYEKEIRELWVRFIKLLYPDRLPKIRKGEAWAAALELCYCSKHSIDVQKTILAEYYGITYSTLCKNYNRLRSVLKL